MCYKESLVKKNLTFCLKLYLSNMHVKLLFQILQFYCVLK